MATGMGTSGGPNSNVIVCSAAAAFARTANASSFLPAARRSSASASCTITSARMEYAGPAACSFATDACASACSARRRSVACLRASASPLRHAVSTSAYAIVNRSPA